MFSRIWGSRFETVIHVGAHLGEEMNDYLSAGWGKQLTIWIEALPSLCERINQNVSHLPNHRVINTVLDHTHHEVEFYEATNDQASSLLRMSGHADLYPEISVQRTHRLKAQRFDELEIGSIRFPAIVRIDIQGAELRALQGFGEKLREFSVIWAEYSEIELYEGSAVLRDLDSFLQAHGFSRIGRIPYHRTWGDGIWMRTEEIPHGRSIRQVLTAATVFYNRVQSKLAFEARRLSPRKR
jgi:FkbM family methyltransferase